MAGEARCTSLPPGAPCVLSRRAAAIALVIVLLVAGLLRLPYLGSAPPGLNQDEAANAWNAYCLLKTGRDQVGTPWPIFYLRALGENRSTLFVYVLLPFQAIGGLNIWTTRLPAALGGVLTVLLTYWVVARLFGRGCGLVAAAFLALSPVHIQLSRWGHEASIVPLLTLAPLAALLWAGFPLDDRSDPQPRPGRAVLAGLLTGVACYGYPAVRLFLPVFLAAGALLTGRACRRLTRTRGGMLALVGFLVAVTATLGPLVYEHMAEPDVIGKRARATWVWSPGDSPVVRVEKVLARYAAHFGSRFLFELGDEDEVVWTPNLGFLPWCALPLQLAGLGLLMPKLRTSRAARVLLAAVVLYPVGDCLNTHVSVQATRSLPGLVPLLALAALPVARAAAVLHHRRLWTSLLVASAALATMVIDTYARFHRGYYVDQPRKLLVYQGRHVDLLAACAWLRPRLDQVEAVFCTPLDRNQPYVITLVALGHDPRRWFAQPRQVDTTGAWDRYLRYGKFYFLDEAERRPVLREMKAAGRPERVILLLRPNEPAPNEPVARIARADGGIALLIYDLQL